MVDYRADLKHATIDYDSNGVTDVFPAKNRTIFHVGPIAELEVRDGGANPEVSSDRRAFTVEAVNNGPDPSLGAEVTVRLPAGVNVEEARPSAGSYDAARNVWVLGELPVNRPHTLVLITDADAGTEISAAIAIDDTAPYTVCIDSSGDDLDHDIEAACEAVTGASWHEGTVFDYLDSNNTASIRARTGLAGGVRGAAPAQVHAIATGPQANLVYWKEPESGSEHDELGPVLSWDIDYNDGEGAGWTPLLRNYLEYSGHRYYANHNVPEGSMRQYRVRARYEERASEWTVQSEPGTARAAAVAREPGVTISRDTLTLREGGSGSYTVRLDARPAGDVVIDVSNSNPDVRLTPTDRLVFTPSNWNRAQTMTVYADEDGDVADETDVISHVIDQAATSADYDYFILPDVTVSVTDNDTAPRFIVGGSSRTEIFVDEGGSTTYQIVLGNRPTEDVRVSLSYPSGMIQVSPRSLTFTPENYNTPQTITVTGVQDDDAVDDEAAFICHRYSGGYAEEQCLPVVVVDDDRAGVGGEVELVQSRGDCPGTWEALSASAIKVTGYPEHAGGCFYSLRLNKLPTGNVTVSMRADARKVDLDADIYTDTKESRLVFTPENWRDAQEVRFEPVWDADGVHNNDFTIAHSISGGGFNNVVIPEIQVNVIDHDRKHIGFRVEGPHGGVQVEEGGSCSWNEDLYQAAFYMFPETQPMSTVTVTMRSDNSDVRMSPQRLSFNRSNWDRGAEEGNPGKRVMVCAAQDADNQDDTANITFTVTSSDADYNGRELTPVPVRVEDDDKEQ